jgi:hypothetical protein
MSDESIASIARDLARAMMQRARSRTAEDQKLVLELQTLLCAEVVEEGRKIFAQESEIGLTSP